MLGPPLVDTLSHSRLRKPQKSFDPLPRPERQARARAELDSYVAGHHLQELRKAIGRTQTGVARILGVSQPRVSHIENGDVEAMEPDIIWCERGVPAP
jgi:DNA-binding XRE family transcriptional regulator